jgi:hypothetical protein
MADEEKKGSPLKKFVVGAVLLLAGAAGVAFFVPLVDCTTCGGSGSNDIRIPKIGWTAQAGCECRGGKMTLAQRYRLQALKTSLPDALKK